MNNQPGNTAYYAAQQPPAYGGQQPPAYGGQPGYGFVLPPPSAPMQTIGGVAPSSPYVPPYQNGEFSSFAHLNIYALRISGVYICLYLHLYKYNKYNFQFVACRKKSLIFELNDCSTIIVYFLKRTHVMFDDEDLY